MSQVDLPSPPDDAPPTIDLQEAGFADPDSPEGIGEMFNCLATCAEGYGHHRVMAASRRNSEGEKIEEMMEMGDCLNSAKLWLDEALPRLRRLKSDVIKDRIPEAGPFLCEAGKLAERIYADMRFDWTMLPELRKIALESYIRPGSPGWDPLDNSLRQFSNTAGIFKNRLDTLAATLRDSYANKLRQVATSQIENVHDVPEGYRLGKEVVGLDGLPIHINTIRGWAESDHESSIYCADGLAWRIEWLDKRVAKHHRRPKRQS